MPVMTFAASAALRERMFLAYNTRAYPANKQILLDLLATRQEIACVLGFRSWADLATADQMMGSAANVRTFLAKLDEASRDGAQREHELVLEFAREQQPELEDIDITSRGYWYEQFRRARVRLRFAVRAAVFPLRARLRPACLKRRRSCSKWSSGRRGAGVGHGGFRLRGVVDERGSQLWAASISTCIRAKARTSGSPRRRW